MPLVSICIPAFNADKYIIKALTSVREQVFTNWEIIVTEDGSKDQTEKIVQKLANEVSQRVIYQRHSENRGPSATRNTCIEKASGDYIALLDADDYWASSHLDTIMNYYLNSEVDIVHSGSMLFDSKTGIELELRIPPESNKDGFLFSLYNHRYIIQPSSVVLRKNVFSKVGFFDPYFRYWEDVEYWFRAARVGYIFAFTGQNTCYYRKRISGLSANSINMAEAAAGVYNKHLDWKAIPRAVRIKKTALAYANAGRMHFRQNPSRSASFYFKAWKIDPLQFHYFVFSFLGKLKTLLI